MVIKKTIALLCMLVLLISSVFAEDINELVINEVNVEIPGFDIYIDVQNNAGEQTFDISESADNLKVVIDGKEASIGEVSKNADEPTAYILAIDISKSLSSREFDEVKEMITTWIDLLKEEDYVAVITFGEDVKLHNEYEKDKESLKNMIQEMKLTDKSTKLYEAISMAHKYANTTNYDIPRKKSIVIISDGADDYPGGITQNEVLDEIRIDSIPIYSIGIYNGTLNGTKQTNLDVLGQFSRETKGRYYQEKNWKLLDIPVDIESHLDRLTKVSVNLDQVVADGSQKLVFVELKKDNVALDASMNITFDTMAIDTVSPKVLQVNQTEASTLEILFNEKIKGYENKGNYIFTGISSQISNLEYSNSEEVKVIVSFEEPIEPGEYSLRINNIKDISDNSNEIESKSISFKCDIVVEIETLDEVDSKKEDVEVEKVVDEEQPNEDENKERNMSDTVINIIVGVVVVVLLILLVLRMKNKKNDTPQQDLQSNIPNSLKSIRKEEKKGPKIPKKDNKKAAKKEQVKPSKVNKVQEGYEEGTVLLDEEDYGTMIIDESNDTVIADDDCTVIGSYDDSTVLMTSKTVVKLFVNNSSYPEIESELDHALLMGRANVCNLCLDDDELSRQHAQIEIKNDDVIITDLRSTNGTSVNGLVINTPTILNDEDMIDMGKTKIRVAISEG